MYGVSSTCTRYAHISREGGAERKGGEEVGETGLCDDFHDY